MRIIRENSEKSRREYEWKQQQEKERLNKKVEELKTKHQEVLIEKVK